MIYCFDSRLDFDCFEYEIALAKKNKQGILYNRETKTFIDFEGNEYNIKGLEILPRTSVAQIKDLNDEIKKQNGISLSPNEDVSKINEWIKYYAPKRKIEILKGKDLIHEETILRIEAEYGKKLFLKTIIKNFSSVIPIELLKNRECIFSKALEEHSEDLFMISEVIDIAKDKYGLKEYRLFVLNNEIYNISRMTTTIFHSVDESIITKALQIIGILKDKFPSYYVMDLAEYYNDEEKIIDVIEFNTIQSSGIYLYNSVMKKSNDLLHSSLTSIALEFASQKDECTYEGKMINDRRNLYDIPNSFSGDLSSLCLVGTTGVISSNRNHFSCEDFQKSPQIPNFKPLLTMDDLLSASESIDDFSPESDFLELKLKKPLDE